MDISKIFDLQNMTFVEQDNAVFDDSMSNFLSKISNTEKSGKIGRYGDLFIGIQNNETYDMTISFYKKNKIFETITIKSRKIGILKTPLNMIKMHSKDIYYKIEEDTILDFFDYYLRTYNTEFIYGYIVQSLRMKMRE